MKLTVTSMNKNITSSSNLPTDLFLINSWIAFESVLFKKYSTKSTTNPLELFLIRE